MNSLLLPLISLFACGGKDDQDDSGGVDSAVPEDPVDCEDPYSDPYIYINRTHTYACQTFTNGEDTQNLYQHYHHTGPHTFTMCFVDFDADQSPICFLEESDSGITFYDSPESNPHVQEKCQHYFDNLNYYFGIYYHGEENGNECEEEYDEVCYEDDEDYEESFIYENLGDCSDCNIDIHVGATEVCDGTDNDCDNLIDTDDNDLVYESSDVWYRDSDEDGYGDPDYTTQACDQPSGYIRNDDDCDDTDRELPRSYYHDYDGDGYGDPEDTDFSCSQPSNYVTNDDDCDDNDANVGRGLSYYIDNDGDGYGVTISEEYHCTDPGSDYSTQNNDCDDNDASINPGADEICDGGIDNNCNGIEDDNDLSCVEAYYLNGRNDACAYVFNDADEDECYDIQTLVACVQDVSEDTFIFDDPENIHHDYCFDCDETNPNINSDAEERCYDNLDNDCDRYTDEGNYTCYRDNDEDGYGSANDTWSTTSCDIDCISSDDSLSPTSDDCDDTDPFINPGESEFCNDGYDDDCDGQVDESDCIE